MKIPPQIIDNSKTTLRDFLNEFLGDGLQPHLDIASAFFKIEAYGMVETSLQNIKRFRLLLGKSPEQPGNQTLGAVLLNMMKEEVERFPLEPEPLSLVQRFVEFLKRDSVEVRLYEQQFLHGKTYITDDLVVVGSSNFTPAGLTRNTELNLVGRQSEARYVREEWFDKFWEEAVDFKEQFIELLENSRFGSREYSPYEVYMKTLFEFQRQDIEEIEKSEEKEAFQPVSRVDLSEFQEDAVHRVMSRMKKYGAALVADSVGLGKTWIAKKVIEEFGFYKRRKFLIICPAQLRGMWEKEVKDLILSPFILSQEELASVDFLKKTRQVLKSGLEDISLVVIDESHNFRNPISNRWENCFDLLENVEQENGRRPHMLLLTATPINNTIWDLYWQIMLMTLMKKDAFLKDGIEDIFKHFREVERQQNPELLGDILNEISIRRTRDYIQSNYPDAMIQGKPISFPNRELENVEYRLNESFSGMYKQISQTISHELTMAYYRFIEYKKAEKKSPEEEFALGRMIALEGIFRTILLKRLESSVEAFRISIRRHIDFLNNLKRFLDQGKILTKRAFQKYVVNLDAEIPEEFLTELEDFDKDSFRYEELVADIDKDIGLFENKLLKPVEKVDQKSDAKLIRLIELLKSLLPRGQIILFSYYSDTLHYLFDYVKSHPSIGKYKFARIDGSVLPQSRSNIVEKFMSNGLDLLCSTDVLSEGQNLQSARFLINYDLHWNPTRMIQRAGRIDRIGSPFKKIFVYNFFPEEELEDLLRLVAILQDKIKNIDNSVGLDQTVLGEEVHPKVFGILRRIKERDTTIFEELEDAAFGGGEQFYQPLRDYINQYGIEELKQIPMGIHSGLKRGVSGIFFYYRYGDDYHFWYLYDLASGALIRNKSEILKFIACPPDEKRVIPDFFEEVFRINKIIIQEIERTYKEHELIERELVSQPVDSGAPSEKFVRKMIEELDYLIEQYLFEFPEDREVVDFWERTRAQLVQIRLTKKRMTRLRRVWRKYKNEHQNWKRLITSLNNFLTDKKTKENEEFLEPYHATRLQLITIDLIS